ncbi:hypothetical protein PybrP1_012858 [[Pythium] brassicae (nom. inval.)]|nr:hypothetical protein PybrP1_012858 [[Pythium] brassicae (nom. inval.)]
MLKSLFSRQRSDSGASSNASARSAGSAKFAFAGGDVAAATRDWELVHIRVPPGPLGIVLDGECLAAGVVDEFSALPDGGAGAIESHGAVVRGSVLASVNEFDVLADKLSLLEIGSVLRDTAHLERVMSFRVPPQPGARAPAVAAAVSSEKQALLGDSPSGDSSSLVVETAVATDSGSAVAVAVLRRPSLPESDPTVTVAVKVAVADSKPKPVLSSDGKFVSVDVPPGPMGLNLDGAVPERGVVLGFVALPDGSKGVLETHGGVKVGSVLIEINGENVSKLPLAELRAKLGALGSEPRRLVFRLPLSGTAAKRQSQMLESSSKGSRVASLVKVRVEEDLVKRRKLELALVLKFDRPEIKRNECWFVLDAQWMSRWVAFVGQEGPLPGPITNETLLLPEWRDRLNGDIPGTADAPRDGLVKPHDYRFVNSMVWCLLSELHGAGDAPLLARFVTEISATAVDAELVGELLREPQPKAAALVQSLFARCRTEFVEH